MVMGLIRMISISMMLILSKKLFLQVGIVPVLDVYMAVQSLKIICTSLVDKDMKLKEITLFTP